MGTRFVVELGRLCRETKQVVVEVDCDDPIAAKAFLDDNLSEVYFKDDDTEGWEPDVDWAPEEGTHEIRREARPAEATEIHLEMDDEACETYGVKEG